MALKILRDPTSGLTWAVRLVRQGERWGREDQLVHDSEDPLVVFYDTRYGHTDLGQQVSTYFLSTLTERSNEGLLLDTGSPDWKVSAGVMQKLGEWLALDHRPVQSNGEADKADYETTITVDLKIRDAEGDVVDGASCELTAAQISDIVDQASELVLMNRDGRKMKVALANLDETLTAAEVVGAECSTQRIAELAPKG